MKKIKKITAAALAAALLSLMGCSRDISKQLPTIQSNEVSGYVSPTSGFSQPEEATSPITANSTSFEESTPKDVDNDWLNIPVTAEKDFLYEETDDGHVKITNYIGTNSDVNIPSTIEGKSVTAIWKQAFKGCDNLERLIISDGVDSIGAEAFCDCKSLNKVIIPNSVTNVFGNAFYNCESIQVPYKGKIYDYEHIDWLYDAINLGEDGMKIIDGVLYDVSRELTEVTIPDNVVVIGSSAFMDCKNLTNITIPNGVEWIESGGTIFDYYVEGAFKGCENLASIDIPDSMAVIGDCAFMGCKSLRSITVPDGVTHIGKFTFGGCESLRSIILPDSITYFDKYAFSVSDYEDPDHTLGKGYEVSENIQIKYKGKTYKYNQIKDLHTKINGN